MRYLFCLTGLLFFLQPDAFGQCPEAEKYRQKLATGGHQYSYAADFHYYKCRCESGVGSAEEEQQALAAMQIDLKHYNEFKSSGDPSLGGIPSSCTVLKAGAGVGPDGSLVNPDKGRIFNDDVIGFLNSLSDDTQNSHLRTLVEEMNQNRQELSQSLELASLFGPLDQDDYDLYNMTENIAQAVSVGKFLFNTLSGKKEEEELTPGQREANNMIADFSRELRLLYDEVQAVPTWYELNGETLRELDAIEAGMLSYERITAPKRLLYWEYESYDGHMDIAELKRRYDRIAGDNERYGRPYLISRIEEIQRRYSDISAVPHMANADRGFSGAKNRIQLVRARTYEKLGRHEEARKLRAEISYDVSAQDAVKLLKTTFDNGNYYGSIQYYQPLKQYFMDRNSVKFIYLELPNLNFEMDGLSRVDATYLLGLGVLAHIRSGQVSQAREELAFLRRFQQQLEDAYRQHLKLSDRKKAFKTTDTDFRSHVDGAESVVLAVEAVLQRKTNKHEQSLELIDRAISLSAASSGLLSQSAEKYELWMQFLKLEILVDLGRYDEAKELTQAVKTKASVDIFKENFRMEELRFLMAYIRYKEQDYKGALFALRLLKRSNPGISKYYVLEEDIYRAMGDESGATEARQAYIQNLTNNN